MRRTLGFICFILLTVPTLGQSRIHVDYDKYFTPYRMRLDLVFAGDAAKQEVFLGNISKEVEWSGSKTILADPFEYGEYFLEVIAKNNVVIFSKGFNTLFQEWRTTAEAKEIRKAFNSSYVIPYPQNPVTIRISERRKDTGEFEELASFKVDPNDKLICTKPDNHFKIDTLLYNGECSKKVDLLFVAEGYTKEEMTKFRKDAAKFMGYLFEMEPYKSRKNDFNIWAVESESEDSGTDFPHLDIWKNTAANSNFYTFRTDRYLTAPNQTDVCKLASNAPYDAIYVIVNTGTYGGGGIYNFYGLSMSDHKYEAEVFVHEFGHSFAGLGDEYYDSETSYEDFYNIKVEPWEPNITTKVNFAEKWEDMVGTDGVGLFEGGGYMAKGIFRPREDCRMKTNTAKDFCPVCQRAINRMIDIYTK